MKCRHCKFVFEDDKTVCPNCRKSVFDEPVKKSDGFELPTKKKKKKKVVESPVVEKPKEEPTEVIDINDINSLENNNIKEEHGSDVAGETVGSSVAGEIIEDKQEVIAESEEDIAKVDTSESESVKKIPASNVAGEIVASSVAGEMVASNIAGETAKVEKNNVKVEMTEEDEFITNFIAKDDALKKMEKEAPKGNPGMMVARIAALISVLFFAGVMYYTKVILPKIKPTPKGGTTEIIDDYEPMDPSSSSKTTGTVELDAKFNDETIITQLKKYNFDYNKDMENVDITLNYGTLVGGQKFSVKLNRSYDGNQYRDDVSFLYQDAKISGINRNYTKYNEDLITNMINSYLAVQFDGGVVLYTKASTFQLGNPTTILIFKSGVFSRIEKVVTTYSSDGSSITQCPITFENNTITYCQVTNDFVKGENVEIRRNTQVIGGEPITTEIISAMVTK